MRFNDILKLSLMNLKNHKSRFIINSVLVTILTFVFMLILYLGFSLNYNFNKAKEIYAQKTNFSCIANQIYDYQGVKKIISNKNKKELTSISCVTTDYYFYDFELNYSPEYSLEIGNYPNPNTNEIAISFDYIDTYKIGDKFIVNNLEYIIVGFVFSSYSSINLLDLNYNIENLDKFTTIRSFSISYQYDDEMKNNGLKTYISCYNTMKKYYSDTSEYSLQNYNNLNVKANMILCVCILIAFTVFFFMLGILDNSIMMYLDQSKKFIAISKTYGMKKKQMISYCMIEKILEIIISIIISTILVIVISPLFSGLSSYFMDLLHDIAYSTIREYFTYESNFNWLIILVSFIVLVLASLFFINKELKTYYKKTLKELFM